MKLPEELHFIINAWKPQKSTDARLDGQVCILTGATSGVGYQAAKRLSKNGAHLVIVCRNLDKAKRIKNEIHNLYKNDIDIIKADFSFLPSVRSAAQKILKDYSQIKVLINNAGVFMTKRTLTKEGFETVFCVNHLAPFLFTRLLMDRILQSAPARIIQVNSQGHRFGGLNLDDLNWKKRIYIGLRGYGSAKTAQLLTILEFARQLKNTKVTINAIHPGAVKSNIGMNNGLLYRLYNRLIVYPFLKDPSVSGDAINYLAAAPEMANVNGKYFNLTTEEIPAPHVINSPKEMKIWKLTEQLTGLSDQE